ncbi:hypothetical protein RJ639_039707 [Escallonia herrerae]|uniref:DUF241 domain protein n=1 Tax=Escallonia herrerae TaxID=1293975 RepID=A0AA88WL00_9ASTE|nr:hypothetical protein RJ639_039707 [Escallonia herrerae]
MATSSKCNTPCKVRSNSFPRRSLPSTLRIEEELQNLMTWEEDSSLPTVDTICNGLSGVEELYKCVDDLLGLPLAQKALSHHQGEELADELLDGSVRLLDICGAARDFMSQLKEHVCDLQSALRRRSGDLSIESSFAKYTSFRRKMKKECNRLIADLKELDYKVWGSPLFDHDDHLQVFIRVLWEVSSRAIFVFQSLLRFFSLPVSKAKPTKWSMVSKLMHKGAVTCEERQNYVNEFESADAALCSLCRSGSSEGEKMQIAKSKLEVLEAGIDGFENRLRSTFRRLVKARVSLLNVISN